MTRLRIWWRRHTTQPEHKSFVLASKVVNGEVIILTPIADST
ncbi:MAG: hypothetical protein ACRD29_05845 [Acidimicrobiales bacterium]